MIPIIPLARLGPLAILIAFAGAAAAIVLRIDDVNASWAFGGLVPLLVYLGHSFFRARRLIYADTGREREIIKMGFIVMAADRAARFWGLLFSAVAIATGIASAGIWAYQGYLCYVEQRWVPVTWHAVTGVHPLSNDENLQQILFWMGDTNFGSVVLICGLLIAAPLAAISWRSNNKAKFRRNDLASLKRRS